MLNPEPVLAQAGGQLIAIFQGHRWGMRGALELGDGTLLSWSDDGTLRRWSPEGKQLAVLDEPIWGDKERIFAWAREQGFDVNVLFSEEENPHVAGGRVAWDGNVVYVYDAASGETLARFVGDAEITCLAVTRDAQGEVVVAGDEIGRVYFLRWAGVQGN